MATFSLILFIVLAVMATYQAAFVVWFCRVLICSKPNLPDDETVWPKVAILMSLRGADPQLSETLRRMTNQEYPQYFLRVIVDSRDDPSWPVVERAVNRSAGRIESGQIEMKALVERLPTCGLQCSAFVQAASQLPADVEVVITVDGDLMPHSHWLKELVAPLLDPRVGATFGNRWFMPRQISWGSLVRYLWNVGAVVPMCVFGIPWGGCLAIRRSALDQTGLVEKWGRSIVHDALVKSLLGELGLKVRFVPSLMMAIRERCDLAFSFDFLKRQMMWTRLYHPHWWIIVFHAVVTTWLWLNSLGLAIYAVAWGDRSSAYLAGGGLGLYIVTMLTLVAMLEYSVNRTLLRRQEEIGWMRWTTWLAMPCALTLTQFMHFCALMFANFARRVTWRGVTYELKSPWNILRVDDRPFEQAVDEDDTEASL